MFDYTELKELIKAEFGSIREFAKILGVSEDVLLDRCRNGQVSMEKIDEVSRMLKINDAESLKACFFCHKSS